MRLNISLEIISFTSIQNKQKQLVCLFEFYRKNIIIRSVFTYFSLIHRFDTVLLIRILSSFNRFNILVWKQVNSSNLCFSVFTISWQLTGNGVNMRKCVWDRSRYLCFIICTINFYLDNNASLGIVTSLRLLFNGNWVGTIKKFKFNFGEIGFC